MTYLQLINAVLSRLREAAASTPSDSTYVSLIGTLINEAKREVEDSWNWTALRQEIEVTTASGTKQYSITGAGERYKILQVLDDTNDGILRVAPDNWMDRLYRIGTSQNADPTFYRIRGRDSSGDPYVEFYPIPNGTFSIQFSMVVPQADLSAASDILSVPSMPVILGAYARALSERGEDGSQSFAEVWNLYNKALGDAISIDARHTPNDLIWTVE